MVRPVREWWGFHETMQKSLRGAQHGVTIILTAGIQGYSHGLDVGTH